MAVDDTSDPVRGCSDDDEVDSNDRERRERLVYAFAELEGVFESIDVDDCDVDGSVVRELGSEVEAVRERLTYEPDTVAESELRELVLRIVAEFGIDIGSLVAGSD